MDLLGTFLPMGECYLKMATPSSRQQPALFYCDRRWALGIIPCRLAYRKGNVEESLRVVGVLLRTGVT